MRLYFAMMQAFFKTHKYLLEHLNVLVRRGLMDIVDWDDRLIGIVGTRGVGKTMFLLDYISLKFGTDKSCLYVNLNNLYFSNRSIASFADEFQKTGGTTLVLDQIFKYPGWEDELIWCYDNLSTLKIIFSGSPLMLADKNLTEFEKRAKVYHLEGFSFREFLNFKSGSNFDRISLERLLNNHVSIAAEIVDKVKPLAYFTDYLHHGYYLFFQEQSNYLENLLKNINLILEIDISYLQQIELKYLPKLRKLLYIIACSAPFQPNVSKLSNEVETSRATIINYLKYLNQASLIHLLYEGEPDNLKKPGEIYLQNPNLVFSVATGDVSNDVLNKTFFCNQLAYRHKVSCSRRCDFLINDSYQFNIGSKDNKSLNRSGKNSELWWASEMEEIGKGRDIPLWLFGFLD